MSARDELADALRAIRFPHGSGLDVLTLDGTSAWTIADTVLASGYRKPQVLGYVVVSRDGRVIGEQFTERAAAQARADEWTNDCKTGGVDWDYRVAEITEAAA